MIKHNEKNNIFVLETKNTHYVFGVDEEGYNRHIHWGNKCNYSDYEFAHVNGENSNNTVQDEIRQEITPFGSTMYRECDIKAEFADGCREISMHYDSFVLEKNILKVIFKDDYYPLQIILNYEVYDEYDIIKRYVTLKNTGNDNIVFERIFSAEFSLPSVKPYTFINTNGAWGSEFLQTNTVLDGGSIIYENRRGASNHNNSPYFIAHQNANENSGDVYFASLAYSGNFKVSASRDVYSITRISIGMNDFDFSHTLKPGETFDSPLVYCGRANGFGEMSRNMNRFSIDFLLPKSFNDKPLPVLYNSWEATEFNIDVSQQTALAELAADIGVELFVMDDGWFGKRNNDRAGLGDWYVNKEKFPNGIDELIDNVNKLGMDFGIWVEPEMVNPDSDLYRTHPDWAYHFEHRNADELRHQLVLNMTRGDVQNYIFECLDNLLENHNIKYIKWDMNRSITECYSSKLPSDRQGEVFHRYILGVYDLYERLTNEFPEVLFESCASGGGRFDPGMLYYAPQGWTSDDSDAIERLKIQYGTSMCYPLSSMGSHVSVVPNHQVFRNTPLHTRANVAYFGTFGYELDLNKLTEEEIKEVKEQITFMKEYREVLQFGTFYRLKSPFEGNETVWMVTNEDRTLAIVGYYRVLNGVNQPYSRVRLQGLNPDMIYENVWNHTENYGDELMNYGLITSDVTAGEVPGNVTPCTDFESRIYMLKGKKVQEGR